MLAAFVGKPGKNRHFFCVTILDVEPHALPRRQGKNITCYDAVSLESRLPAQHTCVLPQCGHIPTPKRSCWPALGVALLCVLCLAWTAPGYAASEPPGFAHNCSGFAQDPLFGPLWPGTSEQKGGKRSTALATMVPRLALRGKALATYEPRKVGQTAPTLETVFGLTPGAQREIVETSFAQDARGVVLSPHVPATVAHALTPI